MKKILLIALAAALMMTGTVLAAEPGVTEKEVLVGSFIAQSGPYAAIGVPYANGIKAYFNWVNKNGGVNGRQIKFIIEDDQLNAANTTVAVKKLVEQDKVFALVGGLGTPGVVATYKYLETNKVPHIYQGAGSGLIAIPPNKYIFPVQPNYTTEGVLMVKYLSETKGAKTIAVIYRNLDDGKELAASVKAEAAKRGVKVVADIPVEATASDMSTQILQLTAANPDAIVVGLFNPQSASFLKQARGDFKLTKPTYLMTYSNADLTVAAGAAGNAVGVEAMAWVSVDFTDPNLPIFKVYQQTFPGQLPNAFGVAGLTAAEIFVEGLKRAGKNLTREGLVKAMESFEKFTGMVAVDISYGPYNVNDWTCRLGKQSMYVLRFTKDNIEVASDWIYLR